MTVSPTIPPGPNLTPLAALARRIGRELGWPVRELDKAPLAVVWLASVLRGPGGGWLRRTGQEPGPPAGFPDGPSRSGLRGRGAADHGGTLGRNGGAHGDIKVTNAGTRPCVLQGVPAVSILRASGKPLPVRQVPADGVTIRPVTLPPRGRGAADLVVFWANWCGQRPGSLLVRIAIPGGGHVTGPFNGPLDYEYVPRCLSPGQPSEISVISAYQPALH